MKPFESVRRIITGQRPNGVSVFAIDEVVEPIVHPVSGLTYWPVWGRDEVTRIPYEPAADYTQTMFPSTPTGFRAHVVEFPARTGPKPQPRGEWPDTGLAEGFAVDPDDKGMHWTSTVDVVIVLDGEITLVQGDESEATLSPGAIVVQNGAVHAWRPGAVPARLCFVNLGAELRTPPGMTG